MLRPTISTLVSVLALGLFVVGCGSDADSGTASGGDDALPTIAVTTSILGDVVENLVGDAAEVVVVMPAGADPHDFSASARVVGEMTDADALIVNGAGFEAGLQGAIETAEAEGVPTHEAIDAVETIDSGDDAHEDEHEGVDPHFFTDPARTAVAASAIVEFLLEEIPALDTPEVHDGADAYVAELEDLDAAVEDLLAPIPDEDRILVTNHEALGYFADRYGFEIVGVVVPGGATGGEPSAGTLDELIDVIDAEGVTAIFADSSSPTQVAETIAAETDVDVEVVALFSESLGEPGSGAETYLDMTTTNAQRIAGVLA